MTAATAPALPRLGPPAILSRGAGRLAAVRRVLTPGRPRRSLLPREGGSEGALVQFEQKAEASVDQTLQAPRQREVKAKIRTENSVQSRAQFFARSKIELQQKLESLWCWCRRQSRAAIQRMRSSPAGRKPDYDRAFLAERLRDYRSRNPGAKRKAENNFLRAECRKRHGLEPGRSWLSDFHKLHMNER